MDFSVVLDVASTLASALQVLTNQNIPVHHLSASKGLLHVILKYSRTPEKRILLDIANAREGFKGKVISDTVLVCSSCILAYGLTKVMQQISLHQILRTSAIVAQPKQWITEG